MQLKEKNQKLFIIVGVLLLVVGVSLSYFISSVLVNGNGSKTKITTAVINGATLKIEGILEFEDLDILPGHKSVSSIKVTATGNNEFIPYNLIWKGTNTLTTPLNFTVYKTSEEISVKGTCEKKSIVVGATTQLSEECTISNLDRLGSEVATGTINKNDSKVTLVEDEFITATSTGDVKYYYVILEYPNLDVPQNEDLSGEFDGEVTVEESNITPDINILAAYVVQDDGTYKELDDIPQEGYTINAEKSTCSNGATPTGVTPNITVNNLSKSGTNCYLYFDKYSPPITIPDIIAAVNPKDTTPTFSTIATTDEGVYSVSDPVYGGTSYYWRGAVTNNYVKFAGFCWRIIRINGDGSIRLIYDGTTCHANGTSTTESIAVANQSYTVNGVMDRSEYVGWTYTEGQQRGKTVESNAKAQTEIWYNANITGTNASKVADGRFCNDREVNSDDIWGSEPTEQLYYIANTRLNINKEPSLRCNSSDVYILKAGAITADEMAFAGGVYGNSNSSYYLYNNTTYWTMTPALFNNLNKTKYASVYVVSSSGSIYWNGPVGNETIGLRPVINLKANTMFITGGNGTLDNPYVVA